MVRSLPVSSVTANPRRVPVMARCVTAAALLLVAAGCALAPAAREAGAPRGDGPDLVAIHDPASPAFDRRCLGCHADVMRRRTLRPDVKEAHAAMIPFLPDYDTKAGVTNETCRSCHATVDVVQRSGAHIRRNTEVTGCEGCHGKTGPASRKFYAN